MVVGVGASGALFGIVGALVGYLVVRREVPPRSVLQIFSPGLLVYLAIDSLLGLFVPLVDGAAHIGGLITGFACGLALSRPWPPPPAAYALRRRMAAAGLLACGLVTLFFLAGPGIRARLMRDPEVIASYAREKAGAIYDGFLEMISPALEYHDAINQDFREVSQRIDRQDEPVGMLADKLDRLISRADENVKRLRAYVVEDPHLGLARDRMVSAQAHQHGALVALRNYLETGDPSPLKGIGGYEEHIRDNEKDVESFRVMCDGYLKSNGLGATGP